MPTFTYRHPATGQQFTVNTDTPEGLREAGDATLAGFQLVTLDPNVGGETYDPRDFQGETTRPSTFAGFAGAGGTRQPAAFDLEAAISGLNTDSILNALTAGAITFDQALTAIQRIHIIAEGPGDPLMAAFGLLTQQGFSPPGGVAPPGDPGAPPFARFAGAGGGGLPTGRADGGFPTGGADFDPRDYLLGDYSPPGFGRAGITTPGDEQLGPITERRAMAFENQTPGEAFLRFLGEATRGQALPTRQLQSAFLTKGKELAPLSPLFGFGLGDVGIGEDPIDFFREFGLQSPGVSATRERLQNLAGLLSLQTTPSGAPIVEGGGSLSLQDQQLLRRFQYDPESQYQALKSFLLAGTAPAARTQIGSNLDQIFSAQQATSPDVPFLKFAREGGFFG